MYDLYYNDDVEKKHPFYPIFQIHIPTKHKNVGKQDEQKLFHFSS